MYQRLQIKTQFDITQTNTTGKFRPDQVPYLDAVGYRIVDHITWTKSRNRQRNLETVIQILLLRSQISDVTTPIRSDDTWSFDFTVDTANAYGDDLIYLIQDLSGVPMIQVPPTVTAAQLVASGPDQNIWVDIIR